METFSLGSVSFEFLDKLNIFDDYQEDDDYQSDVIFKCSNLSGLPSKIERSLRNPIRGDLKAKIKDFSKFISESKTVVAMIL